MQSTGNDGCWFIVQSFKKLRSINDKVAIGDKIVFHSLLAMQSLQVSKSKLKDHPGCKEVNLLYSLTSWKALLYMCHNKGLKDYLKSKPHNRLLAYPNRLDLRIKISDKFLITRFSFRGLPERLRSVG
ncbi:inositol 1-4-5-trisphosphate receptor type 1 [Brachionus plicatilis]|uniref:Inositol 1-4-5-trisphosphate receptor type 1 n=1 Tax=Brachionus plicatilis TaxID=10195 RepID=A0A3M7QAP5_BRAPC|nr:inositol 1-4-5-trisphosphate receptor type 1 [Brachionus plicatilis]